MKTDAIKTRFENMYEQISDPYITGRKREELFDKIEFGRTLLSDLGYEVSLPNNRGKITIRRK